MDLRRLSSLAALVCLSPMLSAQEIDCHIEMPLAKEAYRRFHENPEIGKEEFQMADFLREKITSFEGALIEGSAVLPTAVIAIVKGDHPGPVIGLRADMDARKITAGLREPGSHDPRSKVEGVMHNCGHDVHSAALLATASWCAKNVAKIRGTIIFIFQPAEEIAGGADDLVNEGIVEKYGIEALFAAHVVSKMPVGRVSVSSGTMMAGSSYFDIVINGRGGHSALPSATDDIPVMSSKLLLALTYLPARRLDLLQRPAVISFSAIQADSGQANGIPTSASMKGTLRCFEDPEELYGDEASIRSMMEAEIAAIVRGEHANSTFDFRRGSPPLVNNAGLFDRVVPILRKQYAESLDTTPYKGFFAEDFSYFTSRVPCLYFGFGIAKEGLGERSVHDINFTVHPDALEEAVKLYIRLALIGDAVLSSK